MLRIQRLRLVDEAPWSLDLSVLPAARFPRLLNHALTGSLYRLLTLGYRLELDRADETVEAVPAAEDLAEVLGVQPASALLEIRRRAWDV